MAFKSSKVGMEKPPELSLSTGSASGSYYKFVHQKVTQLNSIIEPQKSGQLDSDQAVLN
jgi:hypothetical protein